jgi:hypothetical protein
MMGIKPRLEQSGEENFLYKFTRQKKGPLAFNGKGA